MYALLAVKAILESQERPFDGQVENRRQGYRDRKLQKEDEEEALDMAAYNGEEVAEAAMIVVYLYSRIYRELQSPPSTMRMTGRYPLLLFLLWTTPNLLCAQSPGAPGAATPTVPEWAQPGSATHVQVAPPAGFHRPSKNFDTPLGMFDGQSDIGSALVPGSASYDPGTKRYTIDSAGYNVWYTRDEFRYLWKKMSGDVSLAAGVTFPNPNGYGDRKAVLIIRQDLDDDSKEILVGLHGLGMIQLAYRSEKGIRISDMEYRFAGRGRPGADSPDSLVNIMPQRIGIEKQGDSFVLFVSVDGESMHQLGPSINLHFEGPYYVGIGFCSHLPDKSDRAVFSEVVLENSARSVR